jgi:hypothetical protein
VIKVQTKGFCFLSTDITEPVFIEVGAGIDRIELAGEPPYSEVEFDAGLSCIEAEPCTSQLLLATGTGVTKFVAADNSCSETLNFEGSTASPFGALLLQEEGVDRLLTFAAFGTTIGVPEAGFFSRFFGNLFSPSGPTGTSDAVYGANSDGSRDFGSVFTVNNGVVYHYVLDAEETALELLGSV